MSLDHSAILKAYPNAVTVDDGTGVFDSSGNQITLVQADIDAARVILDAEFAASKYKTDRAEEYPSIGDQLDMLYWDKKNGTTTWDDAVKAVKDKYPKPS